MQDNISKLYTTLTDNGYEDLGSEDKFRNFVKDSTNVKKLYAKLQEDGFEDLGSEDKFMSFVMPSQPSKPQGMIAAATQKPEPPASIARPTTNVPTQKFTVKEQNEENAAKFRVQQENTPFMQRQRAARQQAEAMNKPAFPGIEVPQYSRSVADDREKYKGMVTQAIGRAVKAKSETALSDAMRSTNEELARQGYDLEAVQLSGLLNEGIENVLAPSAEAAVTKGSKIIDKVFDDAQKKALNARAEATRYSGMGGTGMMGAGLLMGEKAYQKEIDPDKLQAQLIESIDKDALRETFNEVYRQAVRYGIDPKDYFNSYVAPHLKQNAAKALDRFMTDQYMPKNDAEYVLSGFSDSITGMLSDWLTKSASQNAYKQMALSKYDASDGMKIARQAVGLIASAPEFAVSGGVSSAVVKKLCGSALTNIMARGYTQAQAQRILASELARRFGTRVGTRIMQSSLSGSVNFATLEGMSEGARQLRDDDFSVGNIVRKTAEGGIKGAIFGAVGGSYAGATEELHGATKVVSNLLGVPVNGAALTISSNAVNELNMMMGEPDELATEMDSDGNMHRKSLLHQWADNTMLDLMMRGTSHHNLNVITKQGRTDIGNRLRSFISPLSESQKILGANWQSKGISDEGRARLQEITGADNMLDALTYGAPKAVDMEKIVAPYQAGGVKPRSRSVDDLMREEQRQVRQQNWDRIMNDRELSAVDKQKLCQIMGAKYHANPTVSAELVNGVYELRDAKGLLNEKREDLTQEERNSIRSQRIVSKAMALDNAGKQSVVATAYRYAERPDAEGKVPTDEQKEERVKDFLQRFTKGELTAEEIVSVEQDLDNTTLMYQGADKIKVTSHRDGTASVEYTKNGVPVRTDHYDTQQEANNAAARDRYQQQLNSIDDWENDVDITLADGQKATLQEVYEIGNNLPEGTLRQAVEGYQGKSMGEVRDELMAEGAESVSLTVSPDGVVRTTEQDRLVNDYYDWAKKQVDGIGAETEAKTEPQPQTEGLYQMGEGGAPDSTTPVYKTPEMPRGGNGLTTEAQRNESGISTGQTAPRSKSYETGRQAVETDDLSALTRVHDQYEIAVKRVEEVVPADNPARNAVDALLKEGRHDEAHALVDNTEMPKQQADALHLLIDADDTIDGVNDAIQAKTDAAMQQIEDGVKAISDEQGNVTFLTLRSGKMVHVVKGDINSPEGTIMVREIDPKTNTPIGDYEQITIYDIKSVGNTWKASDMIAADRERVQGELDAHYRRAMTQEIVEGNRILIKNGRGMEEVTVLSENADGSVTLQDADGDTDTFSREQVEQMAADAKQASYAAWVEAEKQAMQEAEQPQAETPQAQEPVATAQKPQERIVVDNEGNVDTVASSPDDVAEAIANSGENGKKAVAKELANARDAIRKIEEKMKKETAIDGFASLMKANENAGKYQAELDALRQREAFWKDQQQRILDREEAERKAAEQARIELENKMKAQAKAMGTDEPVAHNQRAVTKGGLVIDEQSVGIDSGTATTLDAIGKALGVEIRIDNSLTTGEGMWSPGRGKNGLNLISIKSDTNTALSFLYGHEITHEIKNATQGNDKLWQGFVQAVRKAVGEEEFDARVKEAQERWNEKIKEYNEKQKAKGRTDFASLLDEAGTIEEVCCDFVGERIISDKDFANRLLEEVEKSGESSASIAQRIRDFIDKVLKAMREIVNPTDEQRRQIEGLEQAKKIWGDLYEFAAAKEREKRTAMAEAERQRKEEEMRRKQEARKRAIEKYDKPINDARKRMGDDPDALAVMEDGNREPKTLKEAVAQMIPAHSLVLKNWTDANGRQHLGLEGETGFKHADLSRLSTFIGKRENGAVDIATLAERIYENLPEDMRQQAPDADRDIRNVIIELFSEAEKADDILHYVDNARIREAEAVYQRNKDREAYEAEREAYGQKTEATDGAPEYDASQDPFAGMDTEDKFSIRKKPEPKKKGIGYKVFYRGKDGKLYPPMVANPNGADTPVGVWIDADAAPIANQTKTGRNQVRQGGKGTQGGSGYLSYRPGWHLGEIPYALQFNRKDANGNRTLFPKDFVWAEVEYAADKDYQEEATQAGMSENGKYRHAYAGLQRLPEDGFYKYRTNPNPETDPWIITGAMKVNRVLSREEVDDLVRKAGREPQKVEGDENTKLDDKFSIAQRDKEYADAVAAGDKEKVDAMLREEAEKKGYSDDSSYQGSIAFNGAAPSRNGYFETRQERKEAFDNGDFEDTYSLGDFVETGLDNHDLEWQLANPIPASGRNKATLESIRNLSNAVKSKSGKIKMYRAVDADIKENSFRNGDWITPSREYAQKHIGLQDWKKGRIIEQEVSIDDVWWDGNDINEWGYDDGKGYVYKNTENNRKLLEATYDDKGNLIPLSKRFDEKKSNVKFSIPPKKNADGDTEFSYEGDPKFSIRVFHGSGADFEKFDHKFMGTGEGNQSFGWGTYVTEVEGVGRQYAEAMGNIQTYKGKTLESNPYSDNPADRALFYAEQEHGADKAIKFLKELMKEEEDADTKREYQECIDVLRDKKSWGKSERHIYEVEIPDDNGKNYIDWKAPLTEKNKEDIRAGLIKDKFFRDQEQMTYDDLKNRGLDVPGFEEWLGLRADVLTTSYNGEDFYKGLSQALGGNQIASEFLRDCGFTGIKYPVNAMSGGNSEGTHNYVIFNENDAQIVNNTKFSIAIERSDPFYSNAAKATEDIRQEKATGDQWLAMIKKNGGLKAEEDKWMGLSDWLKGKKSVTKAELQKFIADNAVEIEDVEYAEVNDLDNNPKMQQFQKEYGEALDKYRKEEEAIDKEMEAFDNEMFEKYGEGWANDLKKLSEEDRKRNRELTSRYDMLKDNDIEQLAFGDMIEEYGDDFGQAFEIDYGSGVIIPVMDMYGDDLSGAAKYFLEFEQQPINSTRLGYTTEGLENKREIALTVPTIEPYNEHDEIHFGDAGGGRAVAWIRFGETTDKDGSKVLVIDEIQSKRHQDGREKGYKKEIPSDAPELIAYENAQKETEQYLSMLREKYGRDDVSYGLTEGERQKLDELHDKEFKAKIDYGKFLQENELGAFDESSVPDAPFQKTWHELALKRMLRYAAENGYDKIAWTTGEQQAERYNLREKVDEIKVANAYDTDAHEPVFTVIGRKDGGILVQEDVVGEKGMAELLGKELARKAYSNLKEGKDDYLNEDGAVVFSGDNLAIGGEGMKGFYDRILPQFMDKYGKKWGVKTGEVELDLPNEADRVMHSVDVTPEMKESVMKGQPKFSVSKREAALRDALIGKIREAGIDVVTDEKEGQRVLDMLNNGSATLNKAQKRALETASLIQTEGSPADISSADVAKVQNNLETLAKKYDNLTKNSRKNFLEEVATELGATEHGSKSKYVTIEAKNGNIVTIRLANHNAKVSTFDKNDEDNGISIVVSKRANEGITNDGNAHVVEYYYPETGLRRAEGKPLADIVRAIQQSLYSGEFNDPTGLAERQEVNNEQIRQHKAFHGSGADFDAFDHSHMGEGEGAQAYGWGTYLTEVEGIGKTYARSMARKPIGARPVLYKGEPYEKASQDGWSDAKKEVFDELAQRQKSMGKSASVAKWDLLKELDHIIKQSEHGVERSKNSEEKWQKAIEYLEGMTDEQFKELVSSERWKDFDGDLRFLKLAINDNLDLGRGGVMLECEELLDISKQNQRMYANRQNLAEAKMDALKEFDDSDFSRMNYEATLYTVDIPEDNGTNYLIYDAKMEQQPELLEAIGRGLEKLGWKKNGMTWSNATHKVGFELAPYKKGSAIYEALSGMLGSKKAASEFLHSVGVTGIKFPAEFRSGGREDDAMNYVIFNENDAKISNKVKFFRTAEGTAYGFVKDGKIYIDPRIATSETPVHEYSHLWTEALRKKAPEKWEQIKRTLLNDESVKPFIDKVRSEYSKLTDENDLLDEVLAQYSGKRGAERLREIADEIASENSSQNAKAIAVSALAKVRNTLNEFWRSIADMFGWKQAKASDIADKMLSDLLNAQDFRKPENLQSGDSKYSIPTIQKGDTFEDVVRKGQEIKKFAILNRMRQRKGESAEDFIQRQQDYLNLAVKSPQEARNRVVDEIKERLDSKSVDEMGKKALNQLLQAVRDAKEENLPNLIKRVNRTINELQDKALTRQMKKLLDTKTVKRNQRNMSVAGRTDDAVAQAFDFMKGKLVDVDITEHDSEKKRINASIAECNARIRDLERQLSEAADPAEHDRIAAEIADQKDLKDELREELDGVQKEIDKARSENVTVTTQSVNDMIADLDEKFAKSTIGEGEWTSYDAARLTACHILNKRLKLNDLMAESKNLQTEIAQLEAMRTEANKAHNRQQAKMIDRDIVAHTDMMDDILQQIVATKQEINNDLSGMVEGGKTSLMAKKEQEQVRKRSLILGFYNDIASGKFEQPSQEKAKKDAAFEGGVVSNIREGLRNTVGSFEYLMQHMPKNTLGQDSWMYRYFMLSKDGVMAAQENYMKGIFETQRTMNDKMKELWGEKNYEDAIKQNEKHEQNHGVTILVDSDGMEVRMNAGEVVNTDGGLSKAQATYLYMVWKMPDGRAKLEKMGFDEQSIAEAVEFIGEKNKAWADWVQEEFLPTLREKYNERYVEMYYTSLGKVANYVPLKINQEARHQDVDVDEMMGRQTLNQKTGSLINRTHNLIPVDLTRGAYEIISEHVQNMEEWYHMARVRQDLNYILSSTAIRGAMNANERASHSRLVKAAQIATGCYKTDQGSGSKIVSGLTSGLAAANIALRNTTALKQTLSLPAFLGYSQDPRYIVQLLKNSGIEYAHMLPTFAVTAATMGYAGRRAMMNAAGSEKNELSTRLALSNTMRWCIENVPSFRQRVAKGSVGNVLIDEFLSGDKNAWERFKAKLGEYGMAANGLVDATTCAIGIKSIYDYKYGQLKKQADKDLKDGLITQEEYEARLAEADRLARCEADIYYNGTQQSTHPAFLAPIQMDRDLASKMFTLYKNSPLSYARKALLNAQTLYKLRNWKTLQEEYARQYMEADNELSLEKAMSMANNKLTKELGAAAFNTVLYGYFINWLWNWGGKGLLGWLQGEEDEEEEANKTVPMKIAEYTCPILNGVPMVDFVVNTMAGQDVEPLLLFDVQQRLAKAMKGKEGEVSEGLLFDVVNNIAFRSGLGIDLNTVGNVYLGAEHLVRNGLGEDNRTKMIALMYLLNTPNSNRKQVARTIYSEFDDPDEFVEAVMLADKAVREGTESYKRFMPGFKEYDQKKVDEIIKEWLKLRATPEQKEAMKQKKANTLRELEKNYTDRETLQRDYDNETDPTIKKRMGDLLKKMQKGGSGQGIPVGDRANQLYDQLFVEKPVKDSEYLRLSTSEDVKADYNLSKQIKHYKAFWDELKKITDEDEAMKYEQQHEKEIERYATLSKIQGRINSLKGKLKKVTDAKEQQEIMQAIRDLRSGKDTDTETEEEIVTE